MDNPNNTPWFRITVEDSGAQWLREGGRDLLNSYGYKAHNDEWLLPSQEFQDFEEAAEGVSGVDLDPYWVDEMWDWDEIQRMLLSWGWR